MSETWSETKGAVRRLKAAWRGADEDARYRFAFWVIGHALMAGAIVAQFGWFGVIFCVGLLLWTVSNQKS